MRFALVSIALAGCFTKPGSPGAGSSDGSVDGSAPVPRVLHTAFYSDSGHTPGTTHDGFTISTSGVVDGELLLFIAQIDNGTTQTWPLIDGFSQIAQNQYGTGDVQTNVVEAKIANNEPAEYTGTYTDISVNASGASIVTLIAVSGVDPMVPIGNPVIHVDNDYFPSARGTVTGLSTTRPDTTLIYVNSGDWLSMGSGQATFEEPMGFTKLVEMGDHGDTGLEWGTIEISYKTQAAAGPAGPVTGSTTATNGMGTIMATGYAALIPVQPPS